MNVLRKSWGIGLAIAVILFVVCSCGKQVKTIDIAELKRINKSEGAQRVLISNNVHCISADDKNVWIATDIGVSRYERATKNWKHYTKEDGLSSDNINAVASDRNLVWFGTDDGVSQYNIDTGTWRTFREKDGLKGRKVLRIAVDVDHVWFGTDRGINRYARNIDSWSARTSEDGLSYDVISAVAVEDDYVWIGTHDRVNRYSKTTDSWNIYSTGDGLVDNFITTISASDDYVWFGTHRAGISVYNKTNQTFRKPYTKSDVLSSDDIRSIAIDGNNIWVGTANGGVHRYIEAVDTWVRYTKDDGLASNNISWITAYKSEIWLGTYDSGVSMYDKVQNSWITFIKADSPPEDDVKAIVQDESGKFWIATSGGLMKYDPTIGEWTRYGKMDGLSTEYITDLAINGGVLWIGTARGLASYDEKSNHWQFYGRIDDLSEAFVASLAIVDSKTIEIETNRGLLRGSIDGQSLINISLEEDGLAELPVETGELEIAESIRRGVTSMARLSDDTLLLGTTSGVMEYDISSGERREHRAFITRRPLKEASVANIVFDGDAIWFSNWSASHNGAIIRYDRVSNTWRRFTRETILGNTKARSPTIIKWITRDDKWMWFATDYGVLQYDKSADIWRHFTTEDGLISNNIRRIEHTTNFVWVCPEMKTRINRYDKRDGAWSEVRISRLIHPRNYVYDMQVDGDVLWLTLSSSGVRRISEDGQQRVYMKEDGLAQMGARCLNVDEDYVWVAHWKDRGSGTLSRYDKRAGQWEVYSNSDILEGDMISRIVTGEEYTWIIYEAWREGSVTGYNRETGEWTTIKPGGDWASQIREICEDEGYLWLAPEAGGIKRYHMVSGTWTTFYSGQGPLMDFVNNRAFKADDRYVWLGTPAGISRYDKERESWTNYTAKNKLSGQSVQAVVSDGRYVWCGTSRGISRYDKIYGTWTNLSGKGNPYAGGTTVLSWPEMELRGFAPNDNITALAVDDRFLWVATSGGAGRYDKVTDRWDSYGTWNGLPGNGVSSVVADGYDIWMGTGGGLGKFPQMSDDPNAWISYTSGLEIKAGAMTKEYARTLVSNEVWAVAADADHIWVGTMRGVSRYSKEADTWATYTTQDGLCSDEIGSICVDGSSIWFGSDDGVTAYHKDTGKWVTYTTDAGLASNRVTCIAGSPDALWFGTFDAGLTRYDKKAGTWQTYSRKDGLAHDCVLSVSVDGDRIWVGTKQGLSRYDVDTSNWTTFTEYGDSEDEMDMVALSVRKDAEQRRTVSGIRIAEISSNPPGRDEENLNGEWVKIVNTTDTAVDMAGFTLSDRADHTYEFGELLLPGGSAVTVFTGSGTDTSSSLYWGSKTPIWNNRGDTAYLKDAAGGSVDVYSY